MIILVDIWALPGGHAREFSECTGVRHCRARQPPPQPLPGAAHPASPAGGAGEGGGSTGGGRGWRKRRYERVTGGASPPPLPHLNSLSWPSVSAADDLERQQGEQPTPEEKVLLREEFITQMHQRFLDGKDKDFDYRLVTPPLIALILHRGCLCATQT